MGNQVSPDADEVRLAEAVGRNARRLRMDAGLKLDEVAAAARSRGLHWSQSRVADFESGKVAPNLATLLAVCLALAEAGCTDASVCSLLSSESLVRVNDSLVLSPKQLVALVSGRPPTGAEAADWVAQHVLPYMPKTFTIIRGSAAEERTRKALGISLPELAELSTKLWKRSFSEERDRRSGQGANAQKLGQVTRQLRYELRAAIEAGSHGNDQ